VLGSRGRPHLDIFDEVLASNYVNYNFPTPAPGPEGFKQVIGMFLQAFPDIHETTEDVIAERDKAAVHRRSAVGILPAPRVGAGATQ
jgi:SnoaL-like polyketide cyclase